MRSHLLSAKVTREIVLGEVKQNGPIGVWEMYSMLQRVFARKELNSAVFMTALISKGSGLAIIEGVIDTCPRGLAPLSRNEVRKSNKFDKAKGNKRATSK